MTLRSLIREPLVHFVVLGAVIFLIGRGTGDGGPMDRRVVIGAGQIRQIEATFAKTWQRPPTASELQNLIEDRIREEIYYREALAMGLDRDDTIIRRRLRQKIEFLSEDLADTAEPTREELQAYLEENREDYRLDPRYTFTQLYFQAGQDSTGVRARAEQQLAGLRDGEPWQDLDMDASMLPPRAEDASAREIARVYGSRFADALETLEPGVWQGPVRSSLGLHLILVDERVEGRDPSLDEVLPLVERDWRAARREATNEALYEALREKYTIIVEEPDA